MNLIIVLLRLLHIILAFVWFGLTLTLTFFVGPAAARAGESGQRFYKSLLTSTPLARLFAASAGLTVLIGILLFITGDPNRNFTTTGQLVLGFGALAGLAAVIHGDTRTVRTMRKYGQALAQDVQDNSPISGEGAEKLRTLGAALASQSRVTFYLMLMALLGMGLARYL